MTNKLALAVAVALGIVSIIGIRTYVEQLQKQFIVKTQPVDVLVAARDLHPGMTFTRDDVVKRPFPREAINEAFKDSRILDENTVIDDIVVAEVEAGQVLQTYHFSRTKSSQGFAHKLEGRFGTDDRAMTVPVGNITGVGGMVKPGDYVDLLMSMPFTSRSGTRIVTYTQFQNVLVLATDDITDPNDARAGAGYSNMTLRLTPPQCNTLKYCMDNGGALTMVYAQPGTPAVGTSEPVTGDVIYRNVEPDLLKKLR